MKQDKTRQLLEALIKTGLTREQSKFIPLENLEQLFAAHECKKQMDSFCR